MKWIVKFLFVASLALLPITIFAQKFSKGDIIIKTTPSQQTGIVTLRSVENLYDTTVVLLFKNEYDGEKVDTFLLNKGEIQKWDVTFNSVLAKPVIGSFDNIEIFRSSAPKIIKKITVSSVVSSFHQYIDSIPFLSEERIATDSANIKKHIENLQLASIDKKAYIQEQKITDFISRQLDSLQRLQAEDTLLVENFLSRYNGKDLESEDSCFSILYGIIESKINHSCSIITPLVNIVDNVSDSDLTIDIKLIGVSVVLFLICVFLYLWYRKTNRSQKELRNKRSHVQKEAGVDTPSLVVVGPMTTSVLKRQSIEDIYDSDAYYKIETKEFCTDSAVRTIYIKNTCIKDIYNMYAEDLRNPNNPKEDGCMVIGRWVYDEKTQQYDVSLEYVILPGDDAIFAEYELNFGGKIKLKMSEALRKIRRETDLQYDLTCWIHSHPGLGVFFSNSDNNVHMQLKNPAHPKFLTAFVIDILTPSQEMGIFTFKQDEAINSKNDILKMYSLEEMYKWALQSERKSFVANDYFDTLGQREYHFNECYGIQLSNGAIIDMSFLTVKQNGFVGFVHGFIIEKNEKSQCIVSTVTTNETSIDNEMIGCFIVASHCSIPSIRKAVANYIRTIKFVLVYATTDDVLTSIPVVNQELCSSDSYYGEQKLEELKIWTRRRR